VYYNSLQQLIYIHITLSILHCIVYFISRHKDNKAYLVSVNIIVMKIIGISQTTS